jgi:hypothetical protein
MQIQLYFEKPEYLSASAPKDTEILQVKCINPSYFLRKKDFKVIPENSTISTIIPPQMPSNSNYAQVLTNIEVAGKTTTLATFVVNILLS